jgi:hypothetical protein
MIKSRIPVPICHLRLEYPQLRDAIDEHLDIGVAPPVHPFPSVKMPTRLTGGFGEGMTVKIGAVNHASHRAHIETAM